MTPAKPSITRFHQQQQTITRKWVNANVMPRLQYLLNTAAAKLPGMIAKGKKQFPDSVFEQWQDTPELSFAQGMGTRALYLDGDPDHHFNDALEPLADTIGMQPYRKLIRRSLPELVELLEMVDATEELLDSIIGDMDPVTSGKPPEQ